MLSNANWIDSYPKSFKEVVYCQVSYSVDRGYRSGLVPHEVFERASSRCSRRRFDRLPCDNVLGWATVLPSRAGL